MRKGTSGSNKILAEAKAGAAEDSLTEDQVCASIDAVWKSGRDQRQPDERTVKEMAKFWGIPSRTAARRLDQLVEEGSVEMRNALVDGSNTNLYRLLNGSD